MSRKIFKKYTYDISLDEGAGAHLISWVTGLMVFFVTLALAVNFGLSTVAKNWVTGLSGTLTVEIKPPIASSSDGDKASPQAQQKFEDSVQQVLTFLKKNAAVAEARRLSEGEIKSLIQPWMGEGAALDALPLPALIDIKLTPNADAAQLQSDLKTVEPAATIDSHTDTLDDVKTLVNTATLFMLLLTGVIILLAVITISGIIRSKLLIHQAEVETLHLIGASDEYIASQFRGHTLRGTFKGAVIGLLCTIATLFIIGAVTHTLQTNIFPHLKLMPVQWATLLIFPLLSGSLIAHLTAQATVLKELSRLP
jgi:cell division transport system permease protein